MFSVIFDDSDEKNRIVRDLNGVDCAAGKAIMKKQMDNFRLYDFGIWIYGCDEWMD